MDLKLIHVFLTVYKYQSYTEAAHALEISQPAVSQAIRKLEASLNTQLFAKQGRKITSTRAGEQLAIEFGRGMDIINNAASASHKFIVYCPEDLIGITRDFPETTFRLPPNHQHELLDDLRLQKVDLAIDVAANIDSTFISEPICREKFKVICRQDHPRLSGEFITPSQFSAESHIGYKRRFNGQSVFDIEVGRQNIGLQRNLVMEVSSSHSICMIVAQTDYIGIVRESISRKWANKLGLSVMTLPEEAQLEMELNMIYHQRFKNLASHKEIRSLIKQRVKEICQ